MKQVLKYRFVGLVVPVLLVLVLVSCKTGLEDDSQKDILVRLRALEGVQVEEIESRAGFPRAFQVDVTQPVDHNNPNGATFVQRIYLSHADDALPMVMNTAGYMTNEGRISELSEIISSNHMTIPHRYFIGAQPVPLDWQYLTIEQAAADHHRIVQLFKTIYDGKWINTGASKGGMTALFHRRFYPSDVDVTVAYVAPIMIGLPDPRFNHYLENVVGDDVCREKIRRFQRMVLENREELLAIIADYAAQSGLTFSIGFEAALEYAVLEYWFYFFQYRDADCGSIPGESASALDMFFHLDAISPVRFYADKDVEDLMPLYYQVFTQLGYYTFITDHLQDLLVAVPEGNHRGLAPQNMELTYDSALMEGVLNWLQNEGNNIIYIYGGRDPYTAAAVELTGATNAIRVIEPDANHSIKLQDLTERQLVYDTLQSWLGVPVGQRTGVQSKMSVRENRYFIR